MPYRPWASVLGQEKDVSERRTRKKRIENKKNGKSCYDLGWSVANYLKEMSYIAGDGVFQHCFRRVCLQTQRKRYWNISSLAIYLIFPKGSSPHSTTNHGFSTVGLG